MTVEVVENKRVVVKFFGPVRAKFSVLGYCDWFGIYDNRDEYFDASDGF